MFVVGLNRILGHFKKNLICLFLFIQSIFIQITLSCWIIQMTAAYNLPCLQASQSINESNMIFQVMISLQLQMYRRCAEYFYSELQFYF